MKLKHGWLLVLWVAAGAALASTVIPLNLTTLARKADVIGVGRCLESKVVWSADHTRIYTDWTVAVEQAVKGAPGAKLVVRQLGGELDGRGMIAAGVPRLVQGQEVVLFLGASQEQGVRRVLGLSQGLFPVAADPQTGQKLVNENPAWAGATAGASGGQPVQVPLDQFLAQVRKALEVKP